MFEYTEIARILEEASRRSSRNRRRGEIVELDRDSMLRVAQEGEVEAEESL